MSHRELYSQYVYEYIIETETPLSEPKTFPNCKKFEPSARLHTQFNVYFKPLFLAHVKEHINMFPDEILALSANSMTAIGL